ncbi:MAG: Ig-like domain-containing protein, partial [Verrucomicrobia bacterium]|nr:Ig-like domain-containing protein [Verrucomicrobiota bacterium]
NLVSVTTAAAGGYSVVVSNAGGSVTSSTATLTVSTTSITVALTSPINGAIYRTGANVQLTASVSPISSIARVRFYDGSTLLSSDTSAPFSITRTFAAGVHTLTARATSFSGTTVTSAPVQITVRQRTGNIASSGSTTTASRELTAASRD